MTRDQLDAIEAEVRDLCAVIHQQEAEIARLHKSLGEWVSVKKRLPKECCVVLVDGGTAYLKNGQWLTHSNHRPIQWVVKWWMPIPEAPLDTDEYP